MSQSGLQGFGAYQKARELFDRVVKDMDILKTNPLYYRLIFQQIASADRYVPTLKKGMDD